MACEALRKTAYVALKAAEKFVDANRWPLTVAKTALSAAQGVVNVARTPLDAAKKFLEGVKVAVRLGANAASAIARYSLGGLIRIRRITFDVQIGAVASGHFSGSIEVSFLRGAFKKLRFDLRLKSIVEMAKDLADNIFPGITGRGRRSVEEQLNRALPDFSRKHYFPQESIYRPGTAKRDVSNVKIKTVTELLSEFAKRSAEEFEGDEEPVEDNEPNPLDELDEAVPLADDAREAEEEAEELEHVGDSETYLPPDNEKLEVDDEMVGLQEIAKHPGEFHMHVFH